MKINLKSTLRLLACGAALLSASAHAADQYYKVTVDTSTLTSTGNAPFSLDFQMNYGSGPFGNNATISHFDFGGGSATGTATAYGTAAGSLTTSLTLSDDSANFYNEIYQGFTPGSTLSFYLTVSNNTTINTPDGLIFGILDNNLYQIPTTQPATEPNSGTDLVDFEIGGLGQVAQQIQVLTYAGANNPEFGGDYSGVTVTVVAVPEPSTWALMLASVGAIAFLRRRTARA